MIGSKKNHTTKKATMRSREDEMKNSTTQKQPVSNQYSEICTPNEQLSTCTVHCSKTM